jgi:hypothetical protein
MWCLYTIKIIVGIGDKNANSRNLMNSYQVVIVFVNTYIEMTVRVHIWSRQPKKLLSTWFTQYSISSYDDAIKEVSRYKGIMKKLIKQQSYSESIVW